MRNTLLISIFLVALLGCLDQNQQAESILRHYIDSKVDLIRNYWMESAVALWNATVSGNESDYKKMMDIEMDFNKSNQNTSDYFAPDRFLTIAPNASFNEKDVELLRKLKYSGLITDSLLFRQLNVLYHAFVESQFDLDKSQKQILMTIKKHHQVPEFKLNFGGKVYAVGQIDSILKNTNNSLIMNKISELCQQKGKLIAPEVIRLTKVRNEFAVNCGYTNYYHLSLETQDQDPERIKLMLDEIELKTRDQYFEAKKVIDKMLTKRFRIAVGELRPWHYNEDRVSYLPKRFTKQLDSLFVKSDPVKRVARFFEGIGMPIQNVIDNSRLEEDPTKVKPTSMINVDFKNDIRLIAGISNTHDGLVRMMHLGGHATHFKSISEDVPYLLKNPNPVISEGIAKCFENMATDFKWIKNEVTFNDKMQKRIVLVCQHMYEVDRLLWCRKQLVMAEFEREIYQNPDQDLDLLWHELNLKYLGLNFPSVKGAGFWATSKYNSFLSCNIHSFVLADVLAAQLQHSVENRVLKKTNGIAQNNIALGKYLFDNLYQYGNLLPWEKLIEKATGEPLNSSYFVEELVGNDKMD